LNYLSFNHPKPLINLFSDNILKVIVHLFIDDFQIIDYGKPCHTIKEPVDSYIKIDFIFRIKWCRLLSRFSRAYMYFKHWNSAS